MVTSLKRNFQQKGRSILYPPQSHWVPAVNFRRGGRHTSGMFIPVRKVQKFVFPRGLATQNGVGVYTMVQADEFSCFILGQFFECYSDSQTVKQKANRGFHTAVIDQYFQTG